MPGSIPIFLFSKDSSLTHVHTVNREGAQPELQFSWFKTHQGGCGQNGRDLGRLKGDKRVFVCRKWLNPEITTCLHRLMVCRGVGQ